MSILSAMKNLIRTKRKTVGGSYLDAIREESPDAERIVALATELGYDPLDADVHATVLREDERLVGVIDAALVARGEHDRLGARLAELAAELERVTKPIEAQMAETRAARDAATERTKADVDARFQRGWIRQHFQFLFPDEEPTWVHPEHHRPITGCTGAITAALMRRDEMKRDLDRELAGKASDPRHVDRNMKMIEGILQRAQEEVHRRDRERTRTTTTNYKELVTITNPATRENRLFYTAEPEAATRPTATGSDQTRPDLASQAAGEVCSLVARWRTLNRDEAQRVVAALEVAGTEPSKLGLDPDVLIAIRRLADGDRRAIGQLSRRMANAVPATADPAERRPAVATGIAAGVFEQTNSSNPNTMKGPNHDDP